MTTPNHVSRPSRRATGLRAAAVAGGVALVAAGGSGLASGANAASTTAASSALAKIKYCESGGDYRAVNSSSGASGAYQFLDSTWKGLSASKGYATAASAPAAVQDAAALELYNHQGTSPWAASSGCWSSLTSAPTSSSSSATTPPASTSSTTDSAAGTSASTTGTTTRTTQAASAVTTSSGVKAGSATKAAAPAVGQDGGTKANAPKAGGARGSAPAPSRAQAQPAPKAGEKQRAHRAGKPAPSPHGKGAQKPNAAVTGQALGKHHAKPAPLHTAGKRVNMLPEKAKAPKPHTGAHRVGGHAQQALAAHAPAHAASAPARGV